MSLFEPICSRDVASLTDSKASMCSVLRASPIDPSSCMMAEMARCSADAWQGPLRALHALVLASDMHPDVMVQQSYVCASAILPEALKSMTC